MFDGEPRIPPVLPSWPALHWPLRDVLEAVRIRLEVMRLEVLTHSQVPSNDGGTSLGQAAIAVAQFAKN